MRINKYLALKNYASRRGADELIKKRQVTINGKVAHLGDHVQISDTVEVRLKGKPAPLVYLAYNKPKGVSSESIGKGSKTAANSGPLKDVFPIGGLDKDAHGLMILTNDGRITNKLLSPLYDFEREYRVATKEPLRSSFKQKMQQGVKIEREQTKKCKVEIVHEKLFRVILTEEKKNQVRRMCVALFQEVIDLERTRILNIKLGTLKAGAHRKIEGEELITFLKALKLF
jgi:pseudouridine synthase